MHLDPGQGPAHGPDPPAASATPDGLPSWVTAQPDIRAPLRIETVATAVEAASLRHQLGTWLALDIPADAGDDVVLAVYEAVANVAEHAYADHVDGAGPMTLAARRCAGWVVITVADEGRWRASHGESFRGRGLFVMRVLVDDVHVVRGLFGSVVRLRALVPSTDPHPHEHPATPVHVHQRRHPQPRRHHHHPTQPAHLQAPSYAKPTSPTPPSPGGTTDDSTSSTTDKRGSNQLRENRR